MKTFCEIVSTVLVASASLALSTQALAAETKIAYADDGTPSTIVAFADLDLTKVSDLQTLYVRVQSAAAAVCDSEVRAEHRVRGTTLSDWRQDCVRSSVDGAVRKIGNDWLSAWHRGMQHRVIRL